MKLLLAPHHDDETLFASYLCQHHRPHIVTVLRSVNQEALGITASERENETVAAVAALGLDPYGHMSGDGSPGYESWKYGDDDPDWRAVETSIWEAAAGAELVLAPWPEDGGHEQHNRIGEFVRQNFADRSIFYTTYRYGGPRTTGDPVEPTREQVLGKLRALACYESQILRGPVRFFTHALDEYTRQP